MQTTDEDYLLSKLDDIERSLVDINQKHILDDGIFDTFGEFGEFKKQLFCELEAHGAIHIAGYQSVIKLLKRISYILILIAVVLIF